MDDLSEWIGRKFDDWCEATEDDGRKIHYCLRTHYWGDYDRMARSVMEFTSSDIIDFDVRYKIQNSEISKIALENDEWHFQLEYYC